MYTHNHAITQVRLKGLSAATNYSLADYCGNLAEHYRANEVGVCASQHGADMLHSICDQHTQITKAKDPKGLRLLALSDTIPPFMSQTHI